MRKPKPTPSSFGKSCAPEEIVSAKYSYEVSGAVVAEQWGNWFRVELKDGQTGWVGPDYVGAFHPLQHLLRESLSYLNQRWDGVVFAMPDRSSSARKINPAWRKHVGREAPIEVLNARWVNGYLWLEVAILSESECTGEKPAALARGWVSAHDTLGRPAAWFYSRGC